MDEAYRRWHPPKSHSFLLSVVVSGLHRLCLSLLPPCLHQIKVFWRRYVSQSVVNSFVVSPRTSSRDATGLYYHLVSTDCSPLYNRVSVVSLTFFVPLSITLSVLVSLVSTLTTSKVSCLGRTLLLSPSQPWL